MQQLTFNEQAALSGGKSINWGDFFGGALFAADIGCLATLNPFVCGTALIGHGVVMFVDLD